MPLPGSTTFLSALRAAPEIRSSCASFPSWLPRASWHPCDSQCKKYQQHRNCVSIIGALPMIPNRRGYGMESKITCMQFTHLASAPWCKRACLAGDQADFSDQAVDSSSCLARSLRCASLCKRTRGAQLVQKYKNHMQWNWYTCKLLGNQTHKNNHGQTDYPICATLHSHRHNPLLPGPAGRTCPCC